MATIVCQGLQSCLESQLVEATTLRLKLAAPKSIEFLGRGPSFLDGDRDTTEVKEKFSYEETNKKSVFGNNQTPRNLDLGGWNFLQDFSTVLPKEAAEKESSYIHPLVKRSSSMLSEKSFQLCTENLGSETGSDITEENIFSVCSTYSKSGNSPPRGEKKPRHQHMESKREISRNFPPPLTSMSGSTSFKVRPHREDGRLIIKAVDAQSPHTYLQAERSHGRLRLRFSKDFADSKVTAEDDGIDELENDANAEDKDENYEEEIGEENDMDGNSFDMEVEMGVEEFQRPSRCKEGDHENKRLRNWESLWVATS